MEGFMELKAILLWLGHVLFYPFIHLSTDTGIGLVWVAVYAMFFASIFVSVLTLLCCTVLALCYGYQRESKVIEFVTIWLGPLSRYRQSEIENDVAPENADTYCQMPITAYMLHHIPILLFLIAIGHIPYFPFTKSLTVLYLLYLLSDFFVNGRRLIIPMVCAFVGFSWCYYSNFDLWIATIPAHYHLPYKWFPLPINPTNYDWNFNAFLYSIVLLGIGYNICRWCVNYFFWSTPQQRAFRNRLFSIPIGWIREAHPVYIGMPLVKFVFASMWPDISRNNPVHDDTSRPDDCVEPVIAQSETDTNRHIEPLVTQDCEGLFTDLRLIGFKDAGIKVLLFEYDASDINQVLAEIKDGKATSPPKVYFLDRLDQLTCGERE